MALYKTQFLCPESVITWKFYLVDLCVHVLACAFIQHRSMHVSCVHVGEGKDLCTFTCTVLAVVTCSYKLLDISYGSTINFFNLFFPDIFEVWRGLEKL